MKSSFWVLDTETTGFEPKQGHKIIEIGAIKVVDGIITDEVYHEYIDPQRDIPDEATEVHGMTREDTIELGGERVFADIAQDILDKFKGEVLVAHNAKFDMNFLDHELETCGLPTLTDTCEMVIDSLQYAKTIHPRMRLSLDSLAKKYGADSIEREFHGALLDAQILAVVFVAMSKAQKHYTSQEISKSMQSKRREFSLTDVIKRIPDDKAKNLKTLQLSNEGVEKHAKYINEISDDLSW